MDAQAAPEVPVWQNGPAPNLPDPIAKKIATMGKVAFVLSLLELLSCTNRLVGSFFVKPLLGFYFDWLESVVPGGRKKIPLLGAIEKLMDDVMLGEALRSVPFIVATVLLIRIASRLMKSDATVLPAARTWLWYALGAIAISSILQSFFMIPAMSDYAQSIVAAMPAPRSSARGGPAFDLGGFMQAFMTIYMLIVVVMGAIMMAIFPVVLFVWSGKLAKEITARSDLAAG